MEGRQWPHAGRAQGHSGRYRSGGPGMKTIDGKARTISEILKGKRYGIDYYQREYRWQKKQAKELIDDLTEAFLGSHRPGNPRNAVEKYGNYFLGSIILSERDGQK